MTAASTGLRRTALYSNHKALNARLVDFHGWELPIQYESILKEHLAVRARAGLFDVSHMGQVVVEGPGALEFLQKVNTNDIARIGPGQALYSHLPNERGGLIDDVIVSCLGKNRYFVVVNAATAEKDVAWFGKHAGGFEVSIVDKSDHFGMIAVQGPRAAELVSAVDFEDAAALPRFGALERSVFDQPSVITRTGYTGEDGFEFIVPNEIISRLWENLMLKGRSIGVAPCGLGARDTLRLEAGYLLYGQDVDDEHTSYEADYGWVVKLDKPDFIGRPALLAQKQKGVSRRLRGIKLLERGVPRPGCAVRACGRDLGALASATYSPSLQAGIGVAYLPADAAVGARVEVEVHGKPLAAEIVKPPFYKRPSP